MIIKKTYTGSYGVILDENKVALIKKSRGGYKGLLDLPGGGIEYKETPINTLKREIIEEIGGTIQNCSLLDVVSANIKWNMDDNKIEDLHHIGILYKVSINEKELKKESDGLDSEGASWYLIGDLKKEQLTPFAIYSLEKIGYKIS